MIQLARVHAFLPRPENVWGRVPRQHMLGSERMAVQSPSPARPVTPPPRARPFATPPDSPAHRLIQIHGEPRQDRIGPSDLSSQRGRRRAPIQLPDSIRHGQGGFPFEERDPDLSDLEDLESLDSFVHRFEGLNIRPVMRPHIPSRINLGMEVPAAGGRHLAGRHLLVPGDDGADPVMGAVHLVRAGGDPSEKHFLFDIEGDVNEGQKRLVAKARRGPFKSHSGASTVMDRSAHVVYRQRKGAMEITVKRGAIARELDLLIAKLKAHMQSVPFTAVVFIRGGKKYRLGKLGDLGLAKLRGMILQALAAFSQCGVHLVEAKSRTGAMYRGSVHGPKFKSRAIRSR